MVYVGQDVSSFDKGVVPFTSKHLASTKLLCVHSYLFLLVQLGKTICQLGIRGKARDTKGSRDVIDGE